MAKNLILYYSRKGENYVNGKIVDLKKGNTEICAEFIQKAVGTKSNKSQKITLTLASNGNALQITENGLYLSSVWDCGSY